MTSSPSQPESQRQSGAELHRRETRRQMILPFALAVMLVLAMFGVAALLDGPEGMPRVSIISNFLVSILIICPAIICLFPIYLLIVAAIYGANRLHDRTRSPLERLEKLAGDSADRLEGLTASVSKRAISWNASLAPILNLTRFFDSPEKTDSKEKPDADA